MSGNVTTLPARSVRTGHTYMSSPTGGPAKRKSGATVTRAQFMAAGEGGRPTVYLETSDMPGWTYCLDPDERVTILSA